MNSAVANNVFSVPLRHLSSPVFKNEQVLTESTVRGLFRFVGDSENELLKYLATDQPFLDSDWPLVFFGPTGTGKTSLALSIISKLTDANADSIQIDNSSACKPAIFTSPDFARRFNSAIETDSVPDFRNRIVGSSAILIDNIHLLASHQHVQDELVHILDQVSEKAVPIVFTSHQPPHLIPGLSVQLTSRLASGLALSVQAPGPEARRELIRDFMHIHGFEIHENAVGWLVKELQLTVPKMNQFFSQLKILLKNSGSARKLDVGFFEKLFDQSNEKLIYENSRNIIQSVAREFHLKPADLKANSRKQSVVLARGVAIYLCRELLRPSFKHIGSWFGNRDHSTVLHAYRKTKAIVDSDTNTAIKKSIVRLHNQLLEQFSGQMNLTLPRAENLSETS